MSYFFFIEFFAIQIKRYQLKSNNKYGKLWILLYFRERRIDKIKETDIAKWQTEIIQKGFSYKYKSKIYTAFTALFNSAVKFYRFSNSLIIRVGNFPNTEPKKEMLYCPEDEFTQFITVLDNLQ